MLCVETWDERRAAASRHNRGQHRKRHCLWLMAGRNEMVRASESVIHIHMHERGEQHGSLNPIPDLSKMSTWMTSSSAFPFQVLFITSF